MTTAGLAKSPALADKPSLTDRERTLPAAHE